MTVGAFRRKLNPHTQRSHISSCKRFAAWLKRSPDTATPDEVRRFMRPRSTPRVLPVQTDLGFALLSTTSRFTRAKADR